MPESQKVSPSSSSAPPSVPRHRQQISPDLSPHVDGAPPSSAHQPAPRVSPSHVHPRLPCPHLLSAAPIFIPPRASNSHRSLLRRLCSALPPLCLPPLFPPPLSHSHPLYSAVFTLPSCFALFFPLSLLSLYSSLPLFPRPFLLPPASDSRLPPHPTPLHHQPSQNPSPRLPRMASPARPAAASVSGAFGLPPDARCSFDHPRRREDERATTNRTFVGVYAQPLHHHHQQHHQQQDGGGLLYPKDAVMAAVEECMRKQADALLHSLDAVGGRLSQLELYCYKLERSIGELRSDVMDYHAESTANFRCIDKNLRQVHKSVQILQDRQDLAETPNELSKLQIGHEAPSHKSEATGFSLLAPRESDRSTQVPKHEVALLPIHQVNGMQSPAVQVQSSNGFVLQHLVPVSLSAQHDQQQLNQAPVYYVQSQDHAKSTESKAAEPLVQVVQPLVQNSEARVAVEPPQKSSHSTELYPQPQNHRPQMPTQQVDSHAWHSQQPVVQQQQYIIQHVSRQMAQQQSSSPQSQSAPQVTPLYPPYSSQKPANANLEPISRSVALQPSYSSPQQKHHEVAQSFYGQGNTILLPLADHNIQQQQQPQSLQPHSQGHCPQPSQPSHCSVASYAVQGNGQTYSSTYKNPSNCPATVVAILPQPQATAPMAFHHLGPQAVHNHQFGNMVETASVVGYPRDQVEILPVVTAAQSAMVDKLNAGSNVTSPREWSA